MKIMKLTINKIGKIKKAEINVNGLTLIAGKNDTGKSTVGKILYAVIEAFKNYKNNFEEKKLFDIRINLLLPFLLKYVNYSKPDNPYIHDIIALVDSIRGIKPYSDKERLPSRDRIISVLDNIYHYSIESLPPRLKHSMDLIFEKIEEMDSAPEKDKIKEVLESNLKMSFDNIINNSKYKERGYFNILQLNKTVANCGINNNIVSSFDCSPIAIRTLPGSVFYIESPFVLETILARKKTWLDLWVEIKGSCQESDFVPLNREVLKLIQKEVFHSAVFNYDNETSRFFYQVDRDSLKLEMSDVASGIKSFAVLYALLASNKLNKDALLIIDEPENHLHPEFQIKYADLICLLVSKGFSVVLTSHSPTFIQALGAYSNKYKIKNKTSFYLAEQVFGENYSIITDKTENLNDIYRDLVYPVERLFAGE